MSSEYWLRLGRDYLSSAKAVLDRSSGSMGPPISLLAWQAGENSLKALAVGHEIPKDHDFGKITDHLIKNNLMTNGELRSIAPHLTVLTGSMNYNATRYPEIDPIYWDSMTKEKLSSVVSAAGEICLFVDKKLNLTGSSKL